MIFISKKQKGRMAHSPGFTLAEVLITLAIVGIVAAITIPSIINKSEELRVKNLVKKTISTLQNANKLAKADYDYDEDSYVECVDPPKETLEDRKSMCALINTYIKNATYIPPTDSNHPLKYGAPCALYGFGSCGIKTYAWNLPSGVIIYYYSGVPFEQVINIDINGKKGPNKPTYGTINGTTLVSYTGTGGSNYPTHTGKPTKFNDIYSYPLVANLNKVMRSTNYSELSPASMYHVFGAAIWILTH